MPIKDSNLESFILDSRRPCLRNTEIVNELRLVLSYGTKNQIIL